MSYCKRCGEIGHYVAQCPKPAKKSGVVDPLAVFDPDPTAPVKRKGGNGVTHATKALRQRNKPVPVTHVTDYHCPGCRCRKYATAADRQRAYRERKKKGDTSGKGRGEIVRPGAPVEAALVPKSKSATTR